MARLYKRSGSWWLDYTDHRGARVRRPGSPDKSVATKMLGDALAAAEKMKAGIIGADPREAKRPLDDVLAEYIADLYGLGRARQYVRLVEQRIKAAAGVAHWQRLGDVDAKGIRAFLASLSAKKRTPKTINDARADLHAFCRWAVKTGKLEANPCESIDRTKDKRDKTRRALSVVECRALLQAAPPRRRLVYLTLIYTGLRRSEARALRWSYLHLDTATPFIELPASITKSGKPERVPLVPALAQALLKAREKADPAGPVFRSIPRMPTFRADLERAGIDPTDDRGRKVVLHSLRHSLATMLAGSGVPMAVAQRLMRHTDIRLTAQTYTDEGLLPLSAAIGSLPALVPVEPEPVEAKATGTTARCGAPDDRVPGFVPFVPDFVPSTGLSRSHAGTMDRWQVHNQSALGTTGHGGKKWAQQDSNL